MKRKVDAESRIELSEGISGLYVIIDPEFTRGRNVLEVAKATLEGGAKILQLRDKINDERNVNAVARSLKQLCDEYEALFFVNDYADVARSSGAHGLHVGQDDIPVDEAREILSGDQLIGRSNGSLEEITESGAQGVDYVAVGATFATSTMDKSNRISLGTEILRLAKDNVNQPVVAIGGINENNIRDVVNTGVDAICVVSAVTLSDYPEVSTRELVNLINYGHS